ncbi:hypothetical protein [Aquimarina hainanensis]
MNLSAIAKKKYAINLTANYFGFIILELKQKCLLGILLLVQQKC